MSPRPSLESTRLKLKMRARWRISMSMIFETRVLVAPETPQLTQMKNTEVARSSNNCPHGSQLSPNRPSRNKPVLSAASQMWK